MRVSILLLFLVILAGCVESTTSHISPSATNSSQNQIKDISIEVSNVYLNITQPDIPYSKHTKHYYPKRGDHRVNIDAKIELLRGIRQSLTRAGYKVVQSSSNYIKVYINGKISNCKKLRVDGKKSRCKRDADFVSNITIVSPYFDNDLTTSLVSDMSVDATVDSKYNSATVSSIKRIYRSLGRDIGDRVVSKLQKGW